MPELLNNKLIKKLIQEVANEKGVSVEEICFREVNSDITFVIVAKFDGKSDLLGALKVRLTCIVPKPSSDCVLNFGDQVRKAFNAAFEELESNAKNKLEKK